ncbi:thioredoxin superfamily protein [Actinidia rufa]|uniref:Thioredoxin superfamily protein n=1 Tax=Actinidia rufa TaxID=165716 RepID=A0A7J0D9E7_9ERIC|nr:thioredoxin superfamily protein [Actinidia rufa]
MQQALPYRTWVPPTSSSSSTVVVAANSDNPQPPLPPQNSPNSIKTRANLQKLVSENPVIVFGGSGCCMCHVVKRLLLGLGVNPPVVAVDDPLEVAVIRELAGIGGSDPQFPVVFVGGKQFGGLERVMATHISGELVPILKQAGALWL